jgi:hypothetical protein
MEMKSMNKDKQHREDTKYVQWQDGMYVMLDDLECDYEAALVEDSLRRSVYFRGDDWYFDFKIDNILDRIGVHADPARYWSEDFNIKLTRAQALYIATGDVNI